jgi:hypothetical protein
MNAGIVILKDGTPCLVYDEALPYPVKSIEFSRADFQITLIYDAPPQQVAAEPFDPFKASQNTSPLQISRIAKMSKTVQKQGRKLEYPLDHRFVELLEERKTIAIGSVQDGQVLNVKVIPVVFTGG